MKITVEVTQAELDEMGGLEFGDFADSIADNLEAGACFKNFEYVGYNVYVKVVDNQVI